MEEIFGPSDSVHWYHFIAGKLCVLRRNEHIYNGSQTSSLRPIIYTSENWAVGGTKLIFSIENTIRASFNQRCQCSRFWILLFIQQSLWHLDSSLVILYAILVFLRLIIFLGALLLPLVS
jgi:hypothetical protein